MATQPKSTSGLEEYAGTRFNKEWTDYDMRLEAYPCCGSNKDDVTHLSKNNHDVAPPEVGGITVCMSCGGVCTLAEPTEAGFSFSLRLSTSEDLKVLSEQDRANLCAARAMIREKTALGEWEYAKNCKWDTLG